MDFHIDEAYLTDVTVRHDYTLLSDHENVTHDDLIQVIKNAGKFYSIGTTDHPEFDSLRNSLEQQGYIVTQRGWWNGDRVVKAFTLNGVKFKKNDQFPCAVAMKGHLKFAKKYQRKKGGYNA